MTDYIYSFSLAYQTRFFLMSLGFGFFVGAVYDIFRALRVLLGNKKRAYRFTDILFLITLAFLNFLFFLLGNEGEIRFFAFFGEVLGFVIYAFSVGPTFINVFEKVFFALRQFLTISLRTVTFPFRKFFRFVSMKVKKHLKKNKKSENKSKYPLKVNHRMLYNLTNRKKKSAVIGERSQDGEE